MPLWHSRAKSIEIHPGHADSMASRVLIKVHITEKSVPHPARDNVLVRVSTSEINTFLGRVISQIGLPEQQ